MALNLEQKKECVAELRQIALQSVSVVAAEYRGLSVTQMSELRKLGRESGVVTCVARNTLAKRAFQETLFECMDPVLCGPLVLMFSQNDPGSAARIVRDFLKKGNEKLQVKGLSIGGKLLDGGQLTAVANLPTLEQALTTLASLLMTPVTQFVRTLNEPVAQTARVVAAIRDKKQAA